MTVQADNPLRLSPAPDVDLILAEDYSSKPGQTTPIVKLIVETSITLSATKEELDLLRSLLSSTNSDSVGPAVFALAERLAEPRTIQPGFGRARAVFQAACGVVPEK
jgi:hypothetical protein